MTPDQEALVLDNTRLAYRIAGKFRLYEHDNQELEGLAIEGLCRAAATFDPDRGVRFVTYAWRCIHNHMIHMVWRQKRWRFLLNNDVITDLADKHDLNAIEESAGWQADAHRVGLAKLVDALPLAESLAIRLVYGNGLSQTAAAPHLGVSQPETRRILDRGIAMLREQLVEAEEDA